MILFTDISNRYLIETLEALRQSKNAIQIFGSIFILHANFQKSSIFRRQCDTSDTFRILFQKVFVHTIGVHARGTM